jgi:peptide/nickel transport system permease protein
MRMVRVVVGQELGSDYVRTARAKGLTEMRVLLRHALPNSLLPILTILGLQFGTLLAGAIVTETIFSWPGIGRLAVQAIEARDYPLLQGCILTTATCYVVVNLLTDMLYAAADPRVRL